MDTLTIDRDIKNKIEKLSFFIGNTPLFPIENIYKKKDVNIYAKIEWQQLGNSIKSRPAFEMIKKAIETGELDKHKIIIDASSGNTGIAYASIGAFLGIRVKLILPYNISKEKILILKSLNADIEVVSEIYGSEGSQKRVEEIVDSNPAKYFYINQYSNKENYKSHFKTAAEIFKQTKGDVTHFVAGLGTSGTFTGNSMFLKQKNKNIKTIALQPANVKNILFGWKYYTGKNTPAIYNNSLVDDTIRINDAEVEQIIKQTAATEGLLLSPSSAGNLAGAIKVAKNIEKGTIVTVFPDGHDKYYSFLEKILNK
ncbi:MAG: cysteine synthase family protein [Bacteroidetes bacterium]|nr:cysteine synthase family protein [Bacteroidota bacterium]